MRVWAINGASLCRRAARLPGADLVAFEEIVWRTLRLPLATVNGLADSFNICKCRSQWPMLAATTTSFTTLLLSAKVTLRSTQEYFVRSDAQGLTFAPESAWVVRPALCLCQGCF